jgi:hypothetical protein
MLKEEVVVYLKEVIRHWAWKDWGKPQKFAVAIVCTPAEVRSSYLPSKSQVLALRSACSVEILRNVNTCYTTDQTEQRIGTLVSHRRQFPHAFS